MDVKQYYRKVREVEASINVQFPVVISMDTSDGGKAGTLSEVPRAVAAKLIVEGRAALANPQQEETYRQDQRAARKAAQKAEMARRVQVAIISDSDLDQTVVDKKRNSPANNEK